MLSLRRSVLPLVVASSLLGLVAMHPGLAATTAKPRPHPHTPPRVVLSSRFASQIHGVILNNFGGLQETPAPSLADFRRMQFDGINTVTMYLPLYSADLTSTTVVQQDATSTDLAVHAATKAAHSLGLRVVWAPLLHLGTGEWRGFLRPSSKPAWFASYDAQVVGLASMAQSQGVDLFTVGSEMSTLEPQAASWRALIAAVRAVYSGPLSYMAATQNVYSVGWWDALDAISVSPYWSVSGQPYPTVAEAEAAWNDDFLPKLNVLANAWQRPVLFAEIGYRSQEFGGYDPYDYRDNYTESEEVQANTYAALIAATQSLPWLQGVTFFEYRATGSYVPTTDLGFSPFGKQAECVLAGMWGGHQSLLLAAGVGSVSSGLGCPLSGLLP